MEDTLTTCSATCIGLPAFLYDQVLTLPSGFVIVYVVELNGISS